uniref:Uncharacterized protein n=1 Tax=Arundo donax TaxID=35708 RepID=A0A0A9BLQ2_ARUDO
MDFGLLYILPLLAEP